MEIMTIGIDGFAVVVQSRLKKKFERKRI